ncbi:MAG: M13 family metallopeptidase [Acidobacteria bacterium]|nr:M13 family metallopeptidase [Acidobacteriota bacterium]
MRNNFSRWVFTLLIVTSIYSTALAQSAGLSLNNMDRTADACDDFFQFTNGTWVKNTQVPPSEARWGVFNILGDQNTDVLKQILEKASATDAPKGSNMQLIGDFYSSCIDEARIEKEGIKPIKPFLKSIERIKTAEDVKKNIAELHNSGIPAIFGFGVGTDLKNSNQVLASAGQGGLSLPNTDYYTKTDPKSVEVRAKFAEYMEQMFKMLGDTAAEAKANADVVLKLQTRLAAASLSPVERRDPNKSYNKITVAEASKVTPNFDWTRYFAERGTPAITEMNLAPTKFFSEVNTMLSDVPVAEWQTYLRWMTVNSSASMLPKRFRDASFDFFNRYLNGQKEQQPRWKTCVRNTDGVLGEALGMEYAKLKFTPEQKARMNVLIDNLLAAMKDRINGLSWMSGETKTQALAKLATFKRKIGYPDVLRGYAGLEIKRKSYAGNLRASSRFQIKRNFDDLGKPRDKNRMFMTPPTVNASYNPTNNDITFPAGILQPPFFNFNADDAINYGAIGAVIGHEISHGFDDSGSRFDGDGNLKMWWTPEDRKNFDERAACVVEQFNGYEVQPGLFVNGKLTLGENIGDFAGLTIAHAAYEKSLEGKPKPADIDGFTNEQRFFLGWAQVWAAKATPEFERSQVLGDPHSAAKWRVNGPMSNMPEFAKAWGCKEGQKMVRKDACLIW